MVTVACLLWGNWPEKGKGEEYVHKLKNRVDENLTVPHRFVCFSDREIDGISTIRFDPCFTWNLNKMHLYAPENGLQDRVLALDLDVVPIGPLDDLASYTGKFAVCESFGFEGLCGGSIMGFEAGTLTHLYEDVARDPKKWAERTEGSERLYYRQQLENPDFWQRLYPGQIQSFKRHCQQGIPYGTRCIAFHGKPRPHEVGL